jgi:hypothetical protein
MLLCLFDKESPCLYAFQVEMEHSDELGNAKWKPAHEMTRESKKCDDQCCEKAHAMVPRYPGLAGGRLVGHVKKIPTEIADELMFSFKVWFLDNDNEDDVLVAYNSMLNHCVLLLKAIAGALALTVVDGTTLWGIIGAVT